MNSAEISKELRKKVLKIKYKSQGAHLGSALSCVDILNILYFRVMNVDPKNPLNEDRDRFILSKGHAAAALYAVLCQKGFFPEPQLVESANGSMVAGHAVKGSLPGIEVSTGSLGHGFPMANGMALAAKMDGKKYKVIVMISDGECDEGTTWESALFASHNKLGNLIVVVDYNKIQSFGRVEEVMELEPFAKKWESFGFDVKEVDGHNLVELEKAFFSIDHGNGKPHVILCHTVKGRGLKGIENTVRSHYGYNMKGEEYEKFIKEIETS